jgi:signal transduction histidine kinase
LLAVILQVLNPTELFAQISDSKLKTIYTYQFVQNIEWPSEQSIDSFSIAVFTNDPLLIQDFIEISRTKTLKNKPISIKIIDDILQITKPYPNIIYVEKNFNEDLIKLFKIIENSPVLVITEEYDIKSLVMINLFYVDKQNVKLEFEVNKNSIEVQHKLRILPKLLLLGGSKIDVALLYKKQEELLENAYEKVKKFQLEIDGQQELIDFQHKEIDEQKKAIKVQQIEIENQQFRINSQKNSLDTLINEVEKQRQMISANLIILKIHQTEIEQQQKQKIIENEEMVKRNEVLEKQKIEIQNQIQKIDSQSNILDLQQKRIQTQKWFLFLSFAVVFLTLFLIYFIYRGYRSKHTANKLLEEKNISIQDKNEEIEAYNEELKVTNDELNFQKKNLEIANATKDKFFGIISHDLRNPFNLLLGLSELLVEQINAAEYDKSKEIAEKINQTSSVAFDLLENLLTWSRSQTGQIQFNPSNLNIRDVIDTNILLLKSSAENKGIYLSSSLTDDLYVHADKNMLLTVLRNLLTNAIKFSRNSDKIIVKTEEKDDCIIIHVLDTGIGIDKHVIEKLFKVNENVKTDGTANERGTGLGLILCKEFIDWHQGRIWVESKKGIGSRFSFTLPKVKE